MFPVSTILRYFAGEISFLSVVFFSLFLPSFTLAQEIWPIPPNNDSFSVNEHQAELSNPDDKPANRITINHGNFHEPTGTVFRIYAENTWPVRPKKGEVVVSGNNFIYYPFRNREGLDSFTYLVRDLVNLDNNYSYTVNIDIQKLENDQPILQLSNDLENGQYIFHLNEGEDTVLEKIQILDPDFSGDQIDLTLDENDYFVLEGPSITNSLKNSYIEQSGLLYTYSLKWKSSPINPDYERLSDDERIWSNLSLSFQDQSQTPSFPQNTFKIEVRLNQIWEEIDSEADPLNESVVFSNNVDANASEFITNGLNGALIYNLTESDDLELKIPIELFSPDSKKYQLYYKCDLNDSIYPDFPLEVSFVNKNDSGKTSLNRNPSASATALFNDSDSDSILSKPWNNNDYGDFSIKFVDSDFNSNVNEPIELELWAVPGLDSLGNRGEHFAWCLYS